MECLHIAGSPSRRAQVREYGIIVTVSDVASQRWLDPQWRAAAHEWVEVNLERLTLVRIGLAGSSVAGRRA